MCVWPGRTVPEKLRTHVSLATVGTGAGLGHQSQRAQEEKRRECKGQATIHTKLRGILHFTFNKTILRPVRILKFGSFVLRRKKGGKLMPPAPDTN